MRYGVTTVLCAVIAAIAAFTLFVAGAPAESPGYGKALPLVWPVVTLLLFGCVWFPTLLGVSLWNLFVGRRQQPHHQAPISLLVLSGVIFLPASYLLTRNVTRDIQHRRVRQQAAGASVSLAQFGPIIDRYSTETHRGQLYGSGADFDIVLTLLHNHSLPPELLSRLADSLDDSSYLWTEIAAHPKTPARVVDRCSTMPQLASWIARNPNASPEVLERLSQSTDFIVRTSIARNLNTPRIVLQRLAESQDRELSQFAKANLNGNLGHSAWQSQ